MDAQLLALLYAVLGGISMGCYPAFIKTRAVLAVDVHPVVFQCYKSTMVFLTGWLFLLPRWYQLSHSADPGQPLYAFTYWGLLSAAAWVPSGISTIFAVPRVGMGMTTAVSAATASFLSFMVFWLVFDSKMKAYPCGHGCVYYRAPIYLAATIVGMFLMIFSKNVAAKLGCGETPALKAARTENDMLREQLGGSINAPQGATVPKDSPANWMVGMLGGISSGTFGALQYAVVNIGKHHEQGRHGCREAPDACPAALKEQFNTFGSWMVSFGVGALAMAAVVICCVSVRPRGGAPAGLPNFHFRILGPPGCAGVLAGSFWAVGNFLTTTGVEIGGNAVVMAQGLSSTIITAGLLGIFYYGEGGSAGCKAVWVAAAVWTLMAMILLGLEKATGDTVAGSGSGSLGSDGLA